MTQEQAITLANEKRTISGNLAKLYEERANIERAVKLTQAELMALITSETNGDGKPKYSNPEKRAAELAIREAGQSLHQANLARLEAIQRSIGTMNIDHAFATDMLNIAVAFAGN